jgi:hypothetical protein
LPTRAKHLQGRFRRVWSKDAQRVEGTVRAFIGGPLDLAAAEGERRRPAAAVRGRSAARTWSAPIS